jgi:hypothetical protein
MDEWFICLDIHKGIEERRKDKMNTKHNKRNHGHKKICINFMLESSFGISTNKMTLLCSFSQVDTFMEMK